MIKITEDSSCGMLKIEFNEKCLFEGNYWDFGRDGESFKNLFERMDLKVKYSKKKYEKWYNNGNLNE